MGKLHELLAVEQDKQNVTRKIIEETEKDFQKNTHLFIGFEKKLIMFDENAKQDETSESQAMTTTVNERLSYTNDFIRDYWDILYQKDLTNLTAKADLVVNGKTLAKDVPAVFLLSMETKLAHYRNLMLNAPTLPVGNVFVPDDTLGNGVYRNAEKEIRFKTAKTFKHKVLYEATKEHPAQIEKWDEQVNVGRYETEKWIGALTAKDKATYLKRIDELIQGCKKARQRANCAEVVEKKIADGLLNYIFE